MKTLTVVFHIDDPTGGQLAIDTIERISPGIRPVVYAWGHLVDELNHYQAALEEIAAVDPGNEWSCQSGMARKALNRQ